MSSVSCNIQTGTRRLQAGGISGNQQPARVPPVLAPTIAPRQIRLQRGLHPKHADAAMDRLAIVSGFFLLAGEAHT